MAETPRNTGLNSPNVGPPVEMTILGPDGQAASPSPGPIVADANGQDREGLAKKKEKARQFAPRHIQMMALGILFLKFYH